MITRRLIITGKVQGVAFRYFASRKAVSLGLRGTVRNLPTGQVEMVAEGDAMTINQLIAWAQEGPPMARVTDVDVTAAKGHEPFTDFTVLR